MSERVARLHRAGLKATGPRMVILSALEQDYGHPTAEQLYEMLRQDHPSLSLSTIYQTLDVFMRTGLCRRVSGPGDRLRVDGTPQDHGAFTLMTMTTSSWPTGRIIGSRS